jgi:hypothetical protein
VRDVQKNNKLLSVYSHNGTITNHKELAEKYKVPVKNEESDTAVMSKIIDKIGFDVLSEYEGSAALVMYFTKEPNVLYAFHGQSKQYYVTTDERPLHYIQIKGSGIYISSEAPPLEFISNGMKATSFKYNMVYKIVNNVIEEFMPINREKIAPKKYNELPFGTPRYDWREDYNDSIVRNLPLPKYSEFSGLNQIGVMRNICNSSVDTAGFLYNDTKYRIYYTKGFFHKNGVWCHGEETLSTWGYIRSDKQKYKDNSIIKTHYLYFYYGILLISYEAFDIVIKKSKEVGIYSSADFMSSANYNKMSDIIKENAIFPFTKSFNNAGCGYMEPAMIITNGMIKEKSTFFFGSFTPLFSEVELCFDNGDFVGWKKKNGGRYTISDLIDEYPYIEDLQFGAKKPAVINKFKSCTECVDSGFYDGGEACITCNADIDTQKDDDNDKEMTLYHTIAVQLNPIIEDIDQLIGEITDSGYDYIVKDKLDIITNANKTLKEIIA